MNDNTKLLEQLLNESNQMIQVSDIQTFSMMYVNQTAREYTGHADSPFLGVHCYEYMMGLKEQCPFCPMRNLHDQESFETEIDNGKEIFAVKTKKVKWDNKDAFVEYAWDVTELRRSQKSYENQIQLLISAIKEAQGIFHLDLTNNTIISINRASKEVLNMDHLETVDNLVSMVTSYIPDASQHYEFFDMFCRDHLIQVYESGKTEISKETLSYFDDKSIRPARITARLFMNPNKNHLEAIIYGMDISNEWNEREKFKEETKEQLDIFDNLARNFLNVFWINLEDGTAKILKLDGFIAKGIDKKNNQFFAYPAILKQYVNDRVHPDDKEMLYQAICIENLRTVFAKENELVGNYRILVDGKVHYFQYNLSKMKDKDYIICGFQNIDSIIEEEKEREQEHQKYLEEQVAIFNNLTRNFRNVYLIDLNKGMAKLLKISEDYDFSNYSEINNGDFDYTHILKKWIVSSVYPEDSTKVYNALNLQHLKAVFNSENQLVGNYRSYEKGVLHNYQYNISKLDDSDKLICGFQIIDEIIEEHLAQEKIHREKDEAYQKELLMLNEEANRANQAKTEFLLRMSHDIRTPLNGIMGMLEIAEKFPNDIDKQTDCRTKVKASAKILLELINEVLDMSKLNSGEIVLEEVSFNLKDIALDVYTTINKQAEERDIEIVQQDCKSTPYLLIGSPTHFKRIMMNIMGNAIKYNTEHGKIFITCREINRNDTTSFIEFKCRDTGVGMSEEFVQHIFEPFAQENTTARSKYGGTGLGMAITKSLVDAMGGTISVESVKGEGSTFTVILPFKIDHQQCHEGCVVDETNCSINGLNILLAEDNDLNMEIARFLLEEEGAHVQEAWNGQEAVDIFKASEPNTFDLILMDVMMPIMDGYQATQTIRSLNREDAKKIPIIAMTANAFAEDKLLAKQNGMNEHISKPLKSKEIILTIVSVLNDK